MAFNSAHACAPLWLARPGKPACPLLRGWNGNREREDPGSANFINDLVHGEAGRDLDRSVSS